MTVQHREFQPPHELSHAIRCLWYTDVLFDEHETGIDVPPDGYAEIVFHFGTGCSISYNGLTRILPSPFLMGMPDHPVRVHAVNRLQVIGIRCYPWTVFDLLGLPAGDRLLLPDHPFAALHPMLNKLIEGDDIDGAIDTLRKHLLLTGSLIDPASLLHKAGIAMIKANGMLPVRDVASAANATVRTLERKFKDSSGHTVKDVSALMRFEQVRNRLWFKPGVGLAGLAIELGYADQSHLSKEFKRYSGTTPAAFARKARVGRHRLDADFVVFVQD